MAADTVEQLKYEAKSGSGLTDAEADALGRELDAIRESTDEDLVETADVVRWARDNPDSEWHTRLCWDEDKAAELHRRAQVRQDMGKIVTARVSVEGGGEQTEVAQVNVRVHEEKSKDNPAGESATKQGYVTVEAMREDDALYRQSLVTEFKRVHALLPRLRLYEEHEKLVEDIERHYRRLERGGFDL